MDSILVTIKKMLGIDEDYDAFDTDIIVNINSALMTLTQIGIGPDQGFYIDSEEQTWEALLLDRKDLESVKMFIYQTVRLNFDPPSNSFVVSAVQKNLEEIIWRLSVQVGKIDGTIYLPKEGDING